MKIFLIVSCLLATAAANTTDDLNKISEAWKDPIEKCSKQHGFAGMTLQEIYQKEKRDGSSCFHACVLRSLGLLNFFGIDARNMGKSVERIFGDQPETVPRQMQLALHCISEVASIRDECEMAYLYFKCYIQGD